MNTESQYEKLYNDLVAGLEKMHTRNVNRTRAALKSLLIVPTFFLILLFLTNSSKTVFLVLWIASMFVIASVLVVIEYQDYLLRKMFTNLDSDKTPAVKDGGNGDNAPEVEALSEPEQPAVTEAQTEASMLTERIRQSVQSRSPEYSASVSSDD